MKNKGHQKNPKSTVRALFFLYAIYRFHLPLVVGCSGASAERRPLAGENDRRLTEPPLPPSALIPFAGYEHLLNRRFEEAIEVFLGCELSDGIASALAAAYHDLGFQTLANQVRRSVRSVRGNQWMFRVGHPADQPLRLRHELLQRAADQTFPILRESTPVRMDLSHSVWSDIFFLGMDFPVGARVSSRRSARPSAGS